MRRRCPTASCICPRSRRRSSRTCAMPGRTFHWRAGARLRSLGLHPDAAGRRRSGAGADGAGGGASPSSSGTAIARRGRSPPSSPGPGAGRDGEGRVLSARAQERIVRARLYRGAVGPFGGIDGGSGIAPRGRRRARLVGGDGLRRLHRARGRALRRRGRSISAPAMTVRRAGAWRRGGERARAGQPGAAARGHDGGGLRPHAEEWWRFSLTGQPFPARSSTIRALRWVATPASSF